MSFLLMELFITHFLDYNTLLIIDKLRCYSHRCSKISFLQFCLMCGRISAYQSLLLYARANSRL